ncbi:MAG TPA: ECF-type sigma factor [Wenzhouxiangellaceae bacterium]|nr:ECF-type sigma factor [Wenzhouxiangellaceae bacterium]
MDNDPRQITQLLKQWGNDQARVREALMPMVYEQLRRIAARQFAGEGGGHTLQPTALVNEAFLQLEGSTLDFNDRRHFYAVASRTMRRILVDHARARKREKRGGDRLRVTLSDGNAVSDAPSADLLDLDQAMSELEQHDERVAHTLELSYFAGLTREQAAEQLDVSVRTLDRDLRMGRAWLKARLA